MKIWSNEIKDLEKVHDLIKGNYPKLDNELQRLIKTDDENIVLVYARRCLEVMITDLCERELKRPRGTEPLKGIIDKLNKEEKVPHNIIVSMQNLNSLSTFGAHPKDFDPMQVKPVLLDLATTLKWYLKYMETQAPAETKPGGPEETGKKPAGAKKATASSKKRILLASAIVLVCAAIVVTLILTDVIKGGKGVQAGEIKSLVVLPFDNYTGADSLEYVVDALHSSLIMDMGKISGLLIPGKTTSRTFKNSNKTLKQIASDLHVDAALETDVLSFGDSICLVLRLILPGKSEKQLWIADYCEDKSQILNLYSRITRKIADVLKIVLTSDEERLLAKSRTVDREAFDDYLRSQQYWGDLSKEPLNKARDYLNSAIEKDPDWAPLYLGLANVWMMFAQMGFEAPSTAVSTAYENLNKALELDPDLPDAHHLMGWIAFVSEWNWAKAEREFLKALAINPSDAMSRIWYAHLLCVLQRHDEALPQAQLAIDLDPLNPVVQMFYSTAQLFINGCEADLTQIEKLLADDPNNLTANYILNIVSFQCGDYDKVIETEPHYLQLTGRRQFDEDAFKEIERIYNEQGFSAAYEKIVPLYEDLANNKIIGPMELAIVYTKGNQLDKVMDLIEKGYEIHDVTMPYIAIKAYCFDSLYDNPRFISILEKMNLSLPDK